MFRVQGLMFGGSNFRRSGLRGLRLSGFGVWGLDFARFRLSDSGIP